MRMIQNKGWGISSLWNQAIGLREICSPGKWRWALLISLAWTAVGQVSPPPAPWVRIDLHPPEAVSAGAQWKFTTDIAWRESGVYYTNIQEGTYQLEYKVIPGWVLPFVSPVPIIIKADATRWWSGIYEKETTQPEDYPTVKVDIYPPQAVEAGARWKLASDTEWRDPRLYYTNVPVAATMLEFKPIEGWVAPTNRPVTIRNGDGFGLVIGYRSEWLPTPMQMLIVNASPWQAIADGAQWKLKTDTEWNDFGIIRTNLPVGTNVVEFKPVEGWITPESKLFEMKDDTHFVSLGDTYYRRPQYVLQVTAKQGEVLQDTWPRIPEMYYWPLIQTNWALYSIGFPLEDLIHHGLVNNAGSLVKLSAQPHPGYQFSGWSGDATGTWNPIVILMDRDKQITANFVPVAFDSVTVTQTAEAYYSPGNLVIQGQINAPRVQSVQTLGWRPILPEGWTLASVIGSYGPVVEQGRVVFTRSSQNDDNVLFNMVVAVPAHQTGIQEIQGEIECTLKAGTNLISNSVRANVLKLTRQDSPAPRLDLDLSAGPPILTIQGSAGRIYAIHRKSDLDPTPMWRSMVNLQLTNSVQTWIDTEAGRAPATYLYRAVLIQ